MSAKWIEFGGPYPSPSGKTSLWRVRAKDGGADLGYIGWYGLWRKYAFSPAEGTVFEPTCLRDITAFIDEQMAARKEAKA